MTELIIILKDGEVVRKRFSWEDLRQMWLSGLYDDRPIASIQLANQPQRIIFGA